MSAEDRKDAGLPKVRQTIVVEGRDDMSAVLAAVDANVLWTHGYGITQQTLDLISAAYEKTGIVIFTDPDHAGRQIRERLTRLFPKAKHAYLTQNQAEKSGDIGIENAKPADILRALEAACCEIETGDGPVKNGDGSRLHNGINWKNENQNRPRFQDLVELGLAGGDGSAQKRAKAGAALGIGSANAKTFLRRLNSFGISLEELAAAMKAPDVSGER